MKKSIASLAMLLLFSFTLFPLQAFAAGGEVKLSAAKQEAAVAVEIPGAVQKDITSIQLSLGITMDAQDQEKAKIQFRFADTVTGVFRDFRLRKDTQAITLYVAGTRNLFEGDSLTLGTLSITGIEGQAQVFFCENSLKTVNGAYWEETLPEITGTPVILQKDGPVSSSPSSETSSTSSEAQTPSPDNPPASGNASTPAGNLTRPSSKPASGNTAYTKPPTGTADPGISTVDKSGLAEAIQMAASLEEKSYTAESFQALQAALTAAQTIYDNPQVSQQEVDAATMNLQNAIGALQTAGSTIINGTSSEVSDETEQASSKKTSDKAGNNILYIVLIVVGVLAAAGVITAILIVRRGKRPAQQQPFEN
ncbi:MAG: DUF5305 domain-containing protein [Clostridiales bacterium]|nr:DUF5305 domain-containing protein [Clostridiales bacterium]